MFLHKMFIQVAWNTKRLNAALERYSSISYTEKAIVGCFFLSTKSMAGLWVFWTGYVAVSQSRTVLSSKADATVEPSREKATEVTGPL
jgi:hypothetical protein